MMGKIINRFLCAMLSAAAAVSCSDKEDLVPARLPEPKVTVSDLGNTSFLVSWDVVTDAGSYTYIFNGGEEVTTRERMLYFSDLEPNVEYTFSVRTDAGINGSYVSSEYVTLHIITDERGVLEMPEPELVASYKSKTIITWKAVRGADSYEYEVGNYSGVLTACSVDLSGFEGSTDYVFRIKAVSTDAYTDASPYAELNFTTRPDDEDIPPIIMDLRETGSDYTRFNIYAVPDFRYLYFAVPATYFGNHTDEEVQKIYLNYVLDAIKDANYTLEAGIAYYASFGSATYTEYPLYPDMSYNIVAFGIDARGQITTGLYKTPTKTLANGVSAGPDVEGPEWFRQRLYHNTFGQYNPSNCLYASWAGKDVASMKYILTSTSSFKNYFGGSIEDFREYVEENGVEIGEENLELLNAENGMATRIALNSATSYTMGSVAARADGSKAFAVSTMATKASPNMYDWLFVDLGAGTGMPAESSLAGRVYIGFDAADPLNLQLAGGKYYFCNSSELEDKLVSDIPGIVASKGTDFTESQIAKINMTGSVDMSFSGLEPGTSYALLVSATLLSGDEVSRYKVASTKAGTSTKASGNPEMRFEISSPRILDIYEFSR
ncbi:MAG: fibronectin type III domain-containing protein [Clostridium sp.]|nr:fibronectin type III domain-containing protein [Bacteroides sp.]MCM1197944.1 fibronectin type III domain-containing protein [Clostridium sp.]